MPEMSIMEEVLGVTPSEDMWAMLAQAHSTLSGEPTDRLGAQLEFARQAFIARMTPEKATINDQERATAFASVDEIVRHRDFRGTERLLQHVSPLTSWSVYCDLLSDYGEKADGSARALLIGAYSALSARAFQVMAQREFGAGQAHVVDLVGGKDKLRHGFFAFASGLQLPYRDGVMDFVQTSSLLHMLTDPASPNRRPRELASMLFSEIWRVLAPGGQVLMSENLVPKGWELSGEQVAAARDRKSRVIRAIMWQLGFENTHIDREIIPMDTAHLFRPDRYWHRDPNYMATVTMGIYGRKPKRAAIEAPTTPDWRRVFALGATAAYTSGATEGIG